MAAADVDMERGTRRQASGSKRLRAIDIEADVDAENQDQEDEGIAQRLAPRRSQQRVLFAEVMAQEREMASLARDKRQGGKDKAPAGGAPAPAKSSKKTRAEARRSQRQALRRAMSPRSPDNRGRDAPLRVGTSVLDLGDDDDGSPQRVKKRRFANNEDAIQDSLLHSTAWRRVKLSVAPVNVLPSREDVPTPFATAMDRPLAFFDDKLGQKCELPLTDPPTPAITSRSGSIGEVRGLAQLEDRVAQLVEEIKPLVKKCQSERARAAIANARAQVAGCRADLPTYRQRAMFLTENVPATRLEISRLERVAARKLLRNDEFPVNSADEAPLQFRQGRGDSTQAGRVVLVESVNYLSVIAPTRKSTTCVVTRATHRVDDDPIMRYVPFFAAGARDQSKVDISQFEGIAGPRKETLVGCDDEANEYILRYVNAQCEGNPAALEVVKRLGYSQQPLTDIAEMKRRELREKLAQDRARCGGAASAVAAKLMAVHQRGQRQGIRGRLEQPARPLIVNHLREDEAAPLGLRVPNGLAASEVAPGDDVLLSAPFREFFCRRCFVYNCRNHGIHQPRPITRVDPRYPSVKAAGRLARLAVNEDVASEEVPTPSPVPSSPSEPRHDARMDDAVTIKAEDHDEHADADASDATKTDAPNSKEKDERSEDGNTDSPDDATAMADAQQSPQIRRSQRSQTAASTKASTMLLSQRPRERKKTAQPRSRSDPEADASEYFGLDGVYRSLTTNDRAQLLVKESPCGASCCKNVQTTATSSDDCSSSWQVVEMILLDKLLLTLGNNPCAIARVLGTKSCSAVAACTRRRQTRGDNSDEKTAHAALMANLRSDRGRERASGVAGNSYDHLRRTRQQRMRDRGANHEYVPCDHAGASCNSAGCSCMRRDHFCDKACSCARDCANRFPGCRCGPGECRTEACPCFFSLRECDPDVCLSCGACELPVVLASDVVAPELSAGSHSKLSVPEGKMCGNVNILRGRFARIAIAPSETHGWGAFAREPVAKGSFIYEYTGSLLSQDEAERRGNVYDKSTVSFLFDLNEDSVVDATRKGNKSKFANHDSNKPKCFARIMFVNGCHRIAIYALEDIAEGDELFFNYGYNGVIPDWSQARIAGDKPVSDAAAGGNRSASSSRSSSTSSNAPASTAAAPASMTYALAQEVIILDADDAVPADASEETAVEVEQ